LKASEKQLISTYHLNPVPRLENN